MTGISVRVGFRSDLIVASKAKKQPDQWSG